MEDRVNPEGNSELSVTDGGDAIASLLNPQEKEEQPEREAGEPEEANEADATDHVSDEETSQDDAETGEAEEEAETEEGEAPEEPADAASEDDSEEEPKVRLPDGSEVTLTEVEEWRKGNMRDADYRRKTMELAATRKELETKLADITQKSQSFEQQVNFAIEVAQANLPQAPDRSLLETDPIGYWQLKAEYDDRVQQLQQLHAAKQQSEQERQAQVQQERQNYLKQQGEALVRAIPELRDPAKANEFTADLVKTIETYGFSKEDLGQVEDHRLFLLAKDAMAYRKLMANKPKAQAKAKDAPPVQKPGRRPSQNEAQARAKKEKMDRLRQSGSLNDGADVILDLIKG